MARRAGKRSAGDERRGAEGETGGAGVALADFAAVLRYLRGLAAPCEPPVGVGAFDVLCASERHILVWYTPAREGHTARECAIPAPALAAAWAALRSGEPLAEPALVTLGGSAAAGRWLLALLAQLPGVRVAGDNSDGMSPDADGGAAEPLTLRFSLDGAPEGPPARETPLAEVPRTHRSP